MPSACAQPLPAAGSTGRTKVGASPGERASCVASTAVRRFDSARSVRIHCVDKVLRRLVGKGGVLVGQIQAGDVASPEAICRNAVESPRHLDRGSGCARRCSPSRAHRAGSMDRRAARTTGERVARQSCGRRGDRSRGRLGCSRSGFQDAVEKCLSGTGGRWQVDARPAWPAWHDTPRSCQGCRWEPRGARLALHR